MKPEYDLSKLKSRKNPYAVNVPKEDTTDPNVLDGFVYGAVNRCIYCGATDHLEKEHILPFGLNGSAILPKASCRSCASITGSVEQNILRGPFWPVRVYRDLKSRTKHKDAPTEIFVNITREGRKEHIAINIDEAPILLPFPIFDPPSYLSGTEQTTGIRVLDINTIQFGIDTADALRALGASQIEIPVELDPGAFARMIAKIGYALAYAEGEIQNLDGEAYVLPSILGKKDEIGHWVGTLTKPVEVFPSLLHRILIHRDHQKGLLFAEVQLFSDSQTPSYGVILGKLKPSIACKS